MNAYNWATFVIFLGAVFVVGRRRVAVYYVINDNIMGEVDERPITLLNPGQRVVLICHTSAFISPIYSWRRKELGLWKEIKTRDNFGVVSGDGLYQCSVSDRNRSGKSFASRIVQVKTSLDLRRNEIANWAPEKVQTQIKHNGQMLKFDNSTKFVPAKTSPAKFLIEPRDVTVHFGKPFIARCRLNVPVLACIWYRRDMAQKPFILLPDEASMIGGKGNGSCAIGIPRATNKHEGTWMCQPVTYNGTNLQSKTGTVNVVYPSAFLVTSDAQNNSITSGSKDAILARSVDYKPKLKINSQEATDGQVLVLNSNDVNIKSIDVEAECEAYSPTKYANMRWKLGKEQARTFSTEIKRIMPKSKSDSSDELFLVRSSVSFTVRVAEKSTDRIKTAMVPVMCTAEDRWVTAKDESEPDRKHVTSIQVTLNHPVSDVVVSEEVTSTTNLLCSTNGYPQPEVQWQKKESSDWSDVNGATSPNFRSDDDGTFRCWARNTYNKGEKVYSNEYLAAPFNTSSGRQTPNAYLIAMGLIASLIRLSMF